MSNRDTILPLSRIVTVAKGAQLTIDLPNTAHKVIKVTVSDPSGFPEGRTRLTLSGADSADGAASAVFDVVVRKDQQGVLETLPTAEIVTAGLYNTTHINIVGGDNLASGLYVSGVDATYPHGLALLGVSATVSAYVNSAKAYPSYVTVTDVSGNGGYFKVQPGSGAGLYLSAGCESSGGFDGYASGVPGVMSPAQSTVTLTMQPSQSLDTIEIYNSLNTESDFLINYGIIKHANSIRDQEQPEVT